MSAGIIAAVEELEDHLKGQLEEANATKRLINSLLRRMGEQPRYEDVDSVSTGGIRADEYYGKKVTEAAQMYLERVHRATSAEDITRALEAGGFDFEAQGWQAVAATRIRNVAISLSKNPQTFHKLPNGTWGLKKWYPNVKAKPTPVTTTAAVEGKDLDEPDVEVED